MGGRDKREREKERERDVRDIESERERHRALPYTVCALGEIKRKELG